MFVDAYQQSASGGRAKRDRAAGGSADLDLAGVTYDLLELILRNAVFSQMDNQRFSPDEKEKRHPRPQL
jgi:hypothetical protein